MYTLAMIIMEFAEEDKALENLLAFINPSFNVKS